MNLDMKLKFNFNKRNKYKNICSIEGCNNSACGKYCNKHYHQIKRYGHIKTRTRFDKNDIIIKIATDFSRIPGARYPEEGDYSGQEFRQNVLHPALKKAIEMNVKLIVDLDGTAGLGTSFLEESFGGLIRRDHINYNILKQTLIIISDEDPDYKEEVDNYIEDVTPELEQKAFKEMK